MASKSCAIEKVDIEILLRIIGVQKQHHHIDKALTELENPAKGVIEQLQKDIAEKEKEVQGLEDLNRVLIVKDRSSNDELQEARKLLIRILGSEKVTEHTVIGVKRMGEVDPRPFQLYVERICNSNNCDRIAILLCWFWQKRVQDVNWHPFKVIRDGDMNKEVIDDGDDKLKKLIEEHGHDAYKAVKRAMEEMNEYNPIGRQIVEELWNFKEARRATLKEAICYLLSLTGQ